MALPLFCGGHPRAEPWGIINIKGVEPARGAPPHRRTRFSPCPSTVNIDGRPCFHGGPSRAPACQASQPTHQPQLPTDLLTYLPTWLPTNLVHHTPLPTSRAAGWRGGAPRATALLLQSHATTTCIVCTRCTVCTVCMYCMCCMRG